MGSIGRTVPANKYEAEALKEILSDPSKGRPIKRLSPMKDSSGRWDGWSKMYYNYKGKDGKIYQIHYNVKYDDAGNIINVDDFKFKDN